ncbi:MAG: hypothetical protein MK085_11765, partial [Phycisphaerales bacterium]|nr:hypothetical protein [Phycisphaerales bacterium]
GVALFGLVYLAIRPNKVAMDEFDPNNIDPLLKPLIEQASQRKRMLWRTSIRFLDPLMVNLVKQNRARFLEAGVIALVDESLASELKSIPVNEDLLEEEPIITGQLRGMSYTMILPMFVLLSFGSSGVRKLVMGSPFDFSVLKDFLVALFMLYVLLLPWHGRWQLGHFGKRFAGPGWIRSSVGGDGIWTIKDSVLFVRSRSDRPGIHVQLIGPTGSAMSFEFDSLQDEGFIDFWNRWSTRNPRLELIQTVNP